MRKHYHKTVALRVHVPNTEVLGIFAFVILAQVLGKHMIMRGDCCEAEFFDSLKSCEMENE